MTKPAVLHQYQEDCVRFMLERACVGVFARPGLGKSLMTLAAMHILFRQGLVRNALIVCPLRVAHGVWPAEVAKWDFSSQYSVGVLHGKDKLATLQESHHYYVINPEGLPWLLGEVDHQNWPFDVLVLDELSLWKSPSTQRFKLLKKVLHKFKRRVGLTGSPAANSMLDLWSQMFCIDMGATLGQYVTHYRAKYFNQTGFGGYEWKLKPGAAEAIQEVLAPRVKTLMDKDLLELPPLVETTIMITLPDKAMRIYKQMEDTLRLDFSAGRVTAANAAVASGKCRQLASGNTYGEDGVTVHHVHDAKLDALEQLISELQGAPALVAYAYRHEADAIKKRLGDIPTIGGGVSASETAGIIEKWNRGEIPVLLGQPQSMAHGLNLQGAGQAVIWYGLTWSLENYEQTVARVYRQGQTKHVYVYHLVSEGTVDEAVLSALRVKDTAQSGLMRALSDYWKNI